MPTWNGCARDTPWGVADSAVADPESRAFAASYCRALALTVTVLAVAGLVHLRMRSVEARNLVLAREIRDRQRAEEESHRHLLALARVGRLATAGELAASLAHELGQPLTAIIASAGAGEDDDADFQPRPCASR